MENLPNLPHNTETWPLNRFNLSEISSRAKIQMLGPVIPGVLKAMLALQMERILAFPTSCLKSRCGGSPNPDRQLFVLSWLEGVQAFPLKKTGFLCPSCVMKERKSLIPLGLQGALLDESGQGYQHLHRFDSWLILRWFLFCFSLKPKNTSEWIFMNNTFRTENLLIRINWAWALNCLMSATERSIWNH